MQYVYVAKSRDFSKIGVSRNPRIAASELPSPWSLLYVLGCRSPRAVEQFALMSLQDLMVNGLFLDCGPRLAIAAVKAAAVEVCGRYDTILDVEPCRWSVENPNGLSAKVRAGLTDLSTALSPQFTGPTNKSGKREGI